MINTKVAFVLLLMVFSLGLSAQQKAPSKKAGETKDITKTVLAHWKKGEIKTYAITHAKIKSEGGKLDSVSFTYWAKMKVTDSSRDGYHLEWKYILPPFGLDVPHANDIYEFFKGLHILIETSETGEFKGVTNWEELRDHYVKMFELSLPPKKDEGIDSARIKVEQMFNSRQIVEAACAKEIMLLLQAHGNSFSTKESVVNTSLPNPFIPVKPIPAVLSSKISEISPKLDYIKIRVSQTIDKNGALELFKSVFENMAIPKDSALTKAEELMNDFEINDYSEIKATISTGWIKTLYYIRTANSNMLSQKDSYLIKEKED